MNEKIVQSRRQKLYPSFRCRNCWSSAAILLSACWLFPWRWAFTAVGVVGFFGQVALSLNEPILLAVTLILSPQIFVVLGRRSLTLGLSRHTHSSIIDGKVSINLSRCSDRVQSSLVPAQPDRTRLLLSSDNGQDDDGQASSNNRNNNSGSGQSSNMSALNNYESDGINNVNDDDQSASGKSYYSSDGQYEPAKRESDDYFTGASAISGSAGGNNATIVATNTTTHPPAAGINPNQGSGSNNHAVSSPGVSVTVYAAIRAGVRSQGWTVADIIAEYLNQTQADNYTWIFFMESRRMLTHPLAEGRNPMLRAVSKPNSVVESPKSLDNDERNGKETHRLDREIQRRLWNHTNILGMQYRDEYSTLARQEGDIWWWQYDLQYSCFWPQGGLSVTNQSLLNEVSNSLFSTLNRESTSGNLTDYLSAVYYHDNADLAPSKRILDIVANKTLIANRRPYLPPDLPYDHPSSSMSPIQPKDPCAQHRCTTDDEEQSSEDGEMVKPASLDAHVWDWRRYLGLAMLLATVFSAMVLMFLAQHQETRRQGQKTWGNLATNEGVDELLQLGWTVIDSTKGPGEYEKRSKAGHGNEVSMLSGGSGQKEKSGVPVLQLSISAELTITGSPSESSPEQPSSPKSHHYLHL